MNKLVCLIALLFASAALANGQIVRFSDGSQFVFSSTGNSLPDGSGIYQVTQAGQPVSAQYFSGGKLQDFNAGELACGSTLAYDAQSDLLRCSRSSGAGQWDIAYYRGSRIGLILERVDRTVVQPKPGTMELQFQTNPIYSRKQQ